MTGKLQTVYKANSTEAQKLAYDEWAGEYERDLLSQGYTLPSQCATLFAAFVSERRGPFLDAGCGTGMQLEPLHMAGFRGFTGIDLSMGMLSIARRKGMHDELFQATMGERLPFEDSQFNATLTCGAITQGHAPAKSFDELIRVTKSGGLIVFTLRCDDGINHSYADRLSELLHEGCWRVIYESTPRITFPLGEEAHIQHKGWVFEVV